MKALRSPTLRPTARIDVPVDGRLHHNEIGSAEFFAVEVSPFGVDASLCQNPSCFGFHAHVEALPALA